MPFAVDSPVRHVSAPIKGSRFVGHVQPVDSMRAVEELLVDVRLATPGASHHAWAARLADGTERASDDGEPGGTAGAPILARLQGRDILDVAVVVTRWFGGTKLGAGGLVRAYGGCAGEALDRAVLVPWVRRVTVIVRYAWSDSGLVEAVLGSKGIQPDETMYDAAVHVKVALPMGEAKALQVALKDASSGRIKAEIT